MMLSLKSLYGEMRYGTSDWDLGAQAAAAGEPTHGKPRGGRVPAPGTAASGGVARAMTMSIKYLIDTTGQDRRGCPCPHETRRGYMMLPWKSLCREMRNGTSDWEMGAQVAAAGELTHGKQRGGRAPAAGTAVGGGVARPATMSIKRPMDTTG